MAIILAIIRLMMRMLLSQDWARYAGAGVALIATTRACRILKLSDLACSRGWAERSAASRGGLREGDVLLFSPFTSALRRSGLNPAGKSEINILGPRTKDLNNETA
jgi:hypothetical protein